MRAPNASANKQVAQRQVWEVAGGNVETGAPMVLRLNFSNVNPESKSPKHMTAAETRFRAFWKLPSDSAIMRKIPEQESSKARRWGPDSGMMRMIQTQESTLLVRFWNNRHETGSRFLNFT